MLGEASNSPAHLSFKGGVGSECPSKTTQVAEPKGFKPRSTLLVLRRKGGHWLFVPVMGIESYFLFQLDVHSPITGPCSE